ncbi:transferrin isoform X2 [Agrilus planipennis]|nr:transferrin isoform X2 [Agrilus planipennis]XP_025829855.1 transferrin isoform X2 [Agrilus planipennis]
MKKWTFSIAMVILLYVGRRANAQLSNKFKVCAKFGTYNECQQLDRTNEIECKKNFHSVDCLINVNSGASSFGSVTAEEALLANPFLQNVVVLGEYRSEPYLDDSVFQTVVLVKSTYSGGFSGLSGARYCHPGFKYDLEVTDFLLKEFELQLFNSTSLNLCNAETTTSTLVEKHVKTLADFFGPSCRPGPLTEDVSFNQQLKESYPSLCELCSDNCAPFTDQLFMSSLICLTQKNGDVAVSSLNSVRNFFNISDNKDKAQNYRYLCKNGTVTTLDNPCVWSKQPWDLLIANNDIKDTLLPQVKVWLQSHSISEGGSYSAGSPLSPTSRESLISVLMPEDRKFKKIKFFDNPVNLTTYLSGLRNVSTATEAVQCGTTVNWCTVSNAEQEKCNWLAQAGANRGIQPIVNCVQATDKLSCISQIYNGVVDVVDIDTNFGYLARRNGLSALAFAETVTRNLTTVLIVVKSNTTDINIEGLKDKKGCFPEYAGIEWLAFANKIRPRSTCDLEVVVRDFVGDSCMPGAHSNDRRPVSNGYDSKLCGLCQVNPANQGSTATTCNTDSTNLFYGNEGALRCLQSTGEFAVISKNNYNVDPNEFRVLCANGSLALYTGFNVDQNCALTVVINSEVIVKNSNPKIKDLSIAIFEFERWFGQDSRKPFELFNQFNSTWDLLFKDSTPGLDSAQSQNQYVTNYKNQVSAVCSTSLSTKTAASLLTIFLAILSVRLNF